MLLRFVKNCETPVVQNTYAVAGLLKLDANGSTVLYKCRPSHESVKGLGVYAIRQTHQFNRFYSFYSRYC